ncbi:unnamed protein product [Moneuplotes crassus]|uniref:Uncharacterized protein n=1 Tax=Euplotes crassus TaxID=5936 RepID=A0AAD2D8L1_EUPCR|nr:unnamed protein product [Moneuplotes crassus]
MINKKLEEEKYINMLTESSNEEIQSQSDQNKSSEREESSSVRSKSLSLNLLQISVDKVLNFFKNNAETKHVKNYFTVFKNLIIKKWEEHQSLNNPIAYASTMEVPQSTKESMWRSIRIFSQLFPDDHKMNKMDNGARVASPIKRFRPRIVFPEFNCMGKTKFINAFGKCDPDFFFLMIFVCYSSVELEQIFSLTYKNIKIASQENYSEDEQKETVTIKYRSRYRGARNVQSSKLSIDPNFEYPINIQAKNEDENIVPSSFSFKGWLSKRSDKILWFKASLEDFGEAKLYHILFLMSLAQLNLKKSQFILTNF